MDRCRWVVEKTWRDEPTCLAQGGHANYSSIPLLSSIASFALMADDQNQYSVVIFLHALQSYVPSSSARDHHSRRMTCKSRLVVFRPQAGLQMPSRPCEDQHTRKDEQPSECQFHR